MDAHTGVSRSTTPAYFGQHRQATDQAVVRTRYLDCRSSFTLQVQSLHIRSLCLQIPLQILASSFLYNSSCTPTQSLLLASLPWRRLLTLSLFQSNINVRWTPSFIIRAHSAPSDDIGSVIDSYTSVAGSYYTEAAGAGMRSLSSCLDT